MNSQASLRPVLQSLADWRELIVACLDASEVKSVVEIGAENGAFTAILGGWAATNGGRITSVEPEPSDELVGIARRNPAIQLVAGCSPECLADLAPADAYIIDGDHNYYTVFRELRAISSKAHAGDRLPLIVMHDVAWPWGRRDLYYAPDRLPPEAMRPHTFAGGVIPGDPGIVASGILDAGQWAIAVEEGGPKNGVRTAVDDFLDIEPRYRFIAIPMIFGLGILYQGGEGRSAKIEELAGALNGHPVLQRVENNRIELLGVEREHVRARVATDAELARVNDEVDRYRQDLSDVLAEAAQARAEVRDLLQVVAERDRAITRLVTSKSWRATAWLRAIKRLIR